MKTISSRYIVFVACISCVLLTLLAKSSVHEITNPPWYPASKASFSDSDAEEKIVVHFHERRPFYLSYKTEVHGVVADQIGLAFKYADIAYQWRETPAKRQLNIIRKNQDKSCAAGWFKTEAREQFAQYSLPVYQDKSFVAITRSDNTLLQDKEELGITLRERRLQLLVKSGYSYGNFIDSEISKLKPRLLSTTADNQNMLKMIQAHRADYCFMTEEEAQDLLLFSGLKRTDFKVIHFSNMPQGNKRYIICSKMVDKATMKSLNAAIQHLVNIEDNDT